MKTKAIFAINCSLLALCLFGVALVGCQPASSTTPPAALAPGYTSTQDQTFGLTMGALRAGAQAAQTNYATLTASQQALLKPTLNVFINSVNVADTLYLAYHAGVTTLNPNPPTATQVGAAINSAQTAQTSYVGAAGVK